jgi:hypothetical protein
MVSHIVSYIQSFKRSGRIWVTFVVCPETQTGTRRTALGQHRFILFSMEKWTKNVNEGNNFLHIKELCQHLRQQYMLVVVCNM